VFRITSLFPSRAIAAYILASLVASATLTYAQSPPPRFAYVANLGSNDISGYAIDSTTGALTPIPGSPFPADLRPASVVVDPTGRFAYVPNLGLTPYATGSISAYTIDPSSGALTPIPGSPFQILSGAGAASATIEPTGKFLYATLSGYSFGAVTGFSIDPTSGALTPVPGSPFAVGREMGPLVLGPNGKFAYTQQLVTNSNNGNLLGFAIDSTSGALSSVPASPFLGAGSLWATAIDPSGRFVDVPGPFGVFAFAVDPTTGTLTQVSGSPFPAAIAISVTLHPTGKFAYVVDNSCGLPPDGTVTAFTVDGSSGAFTQIGPPFPAGGCPQSMTMHPTGKFAYVTASQPPSIVGYAIDGATGALNMVPGSPFQAGSSNNPNPLTIDPSGQFAYVPDDTQNTVSAFVIDPVTGTLTPVPGSPFAAGINPQAVTPTSGPVAMLGTISVTSNLSTATFTITGPAYFSGFGTSATFSNAPAGTYTITFGGLNGYISPTQQTQKLSAGNTLSFVGTYTPLLLQVSPTMLLFSYQGAGGRAQPQQVTVSTNGPPVSFTAVATTGASGQWLSVTPASDTTPATLTVSAISGLQPLPPGSYIGQVSITSSQAANSPQRLPIGLDVTAGSHLFNSGWTKLNGPWSSDCDGSFGAIAADPRKSNVIYIGSSSQSNACGLFKSVDGGQTWQAINNGFPKVGILGFQHYPAVSKIVVSPSKPNVIYVGTIFGGGTLGSIVRSIDGGRTWTDASGQSPLGISPRTIHDPVLDLSVDPTNPSVAMAGLSKAGIFKTIDGGQNWSLIRGGSQGATDNFYVVRFAQANPSIAYGAGFTAFNGPLFPCVIATQDCVEFEGDLPFPPFELTGGGAKFNFRNFPVVLSGGQGPLITDLAIDPTNANIVYASTIAYGALSGIIPAPVPNLGVFKTQDGGSQWQTANGPSYADLSQFPIFRLVMDPNAPSTLYAVTGSSGVFMTITGGQQWQQLSMNGLLNGTFVANLALGGNGTLYALTSSGVYVFNN
jgi:6-phosphogluconolactonase (cycloisomerase 2 family)